MARGALRDKVVVGWMQIFTLDVCWLLKKVMEESSCRAMVSVSVPAQADALTRHFLVPEFACSN